MAAKTKKKITATKHTYRKFGVRLAHHRHTGKRTPLHTTSYAALFFLLALTGSLLIFVSQAVGADLNQQGSITLSGRVQGPPPTQAAEIESPADNAHVGQPLINVTGSCKSGLIVEIYRNDAFSGSGYCASDDTFSIGITLVEGANMLKVRSRAADGRYAPDSARVTVYYDTPAAGTPAKKTRLPLLIYTVPVQPAVQIWEDLALKYEIDGGEAPYAASVGWDDKSQNDVSVLKTPGNFEASHRYKNGGQYTLTIQAGDQAGNKAQIQTIGIVTGEGEKGFATAPTCAAGSTTPGCVLSDPIITIIQKLWPAFILACLLTLSFWTGEKVVAYRVKHP